MATLMLSPGTVGFTELDQPAKMAVSLFTTFRTIEHYPGSPRRYLKRPLIGQELARAFESGQSEHGGELEFICRRCVAKM